MRSALVLLAAGAAASSLRVDVSPSDCAADGGDCAPALNAAVQRCRDGGGGGGCRVVLAPGSYRVACPAGSGAYVGGPGAVDLGNTTNLSFGAADGAAPAQLDCDYVGGGGGCPAIVHAHSVGLRLHNLTLDTTRLPFTHGTVVAAAAADGGRAVSLRMAEPARSSWDVRRYPWLRSFYEAHPELLGFAGDPEWNATSGVVTLRYGAPSAARAALAAGQDVFFKHYVNMQAWGLYGWRAVDTALSGVTLLSCAGMGLRCDFCEADYVVEDSAVRPGAGRPMSSTADGIHFMHHRGAIALRRTLVTGTGDDCFNTHGTFVVLGELLGDDRTAATYVDQTGPGWLLALPTHLVGQRVAFFSRLTLRRLGPPGFTTTLRAATPGFGRNATLMFADAVPSDVRRYDLMLAVDRSTSLDVEGCTLTTTRGLIVSAAPVRVVNNTFRTAHTAVLLAGGGCGAYEDYTEGPFSRDVLVEGNVFDTPAAGDSGGFGMTEGVVQVAGCRPLGVCGGGGGGKAEAAAAAAAAARDDPQPYPLPPCEPGGSTVPPIVGHSGDSGPGRIQEPGHLLDDAGTVFANVTVRGNTFRATSRFVHAGATAGVVVEGNTMVRATTPGGAKPYWADICVYASSGFDATAAQRLNTCRGNSTDGGPSTCVLASASDCTAAGQ